MNRVLILFLLILLQTVSFSFPITVTDESNTKFTILSKPKRIISTMPSNTEILFNLGLSKKIVGVTTYCNYPKEARNKKKIGSQSLNTEMIFALNPDIIIMLGDAQRNQIELLRKFGLPVFVINPHKLADVPSSIILLGKITGAKKEAEDLSVKMCAKIGEISKIQKSLIKPKVFVCLYTEPLLTAGRDTFIDDMINLSGGINIGADAQGTYPLINFEKIIESDPDYIIVSGKSKKEMDYFKTSSKWNGLKAIKENHIMLIDSDIITRPSPRLVEALDLINRFINPAEE